MRRRVLLLVLTSACRTDWRLPPCEGEDDSTCRVASVDVDGTERTYVLAPPPDYACDETTTQRWPLQFGWHGSGDNGSGFRHDLRDFGVLDALDPGFVGVYPDGLERRDTNGFTGWVQDPDGEDIRFFDVLLQHLVDTACVDPARVTSIGHSRGARFTRALACARAPTHVGFAAIAGGRADDWACEHPAPMWLAHGRDDRQVSYAQGRDVRDHQAEINGCTPIDESDLPSGVCTAYEGCDVPLVFCPYEGADWKGHAIPDFAGREIRSFFDGLAEPSDARDARASPFRIGTALR